MDSKVVVSDMNKVNLIESISGDYYYIDNYIDSPVRGFWLSTKEYKTKEECKKDIVENWPDNGIEIKDKDGTYYRSVKYFSFWKIKSKKDSNYNLIKVKISKNDKRALDYRSHAINTDAYRPKRKRYLYII